jgi:hypothetical protein
LSHLEFDGKVYWNLEDKYDKWLPPRDNGSSELLLPSDSCFRLDLQCLKMKDFESAEKHKHDMEEQQRQDKRSR